MCCLKAHSQFVIRISIWKAKRWRLIGHSRFLFRADEFVCSHLLYYNIVSPSLLALLDSFYLFLTYHQRIAQQKEGKR